MSERLESVTAPSDAELITAVRVGDARAYEELYRRHVDAAMAVGRHLTGSKADAEDVVSEAFARVLSALQRGAGPEMAFRPYLLTSVRNAFYDRMRKDKRLDVTDEVPEDMGRVLAAAASSDDEEERRLAAAAFASLPERWQLVLWHTEVEGRSPAEVAPLLGLAPNAVAALAYRAREGLRQAYLNAHIQARPPAGCEDTIPKLGAYVRNDLSNRDRQKVEAHLEGCERCQLIVVELQEAGSRLRVLLIPLIAGIPATAYLAGIGAGGAGLIAWGTRAVQRAKDAGPGAQAALALGAVAAAGFLVVGSLALARSVTGGGRDETVTAPGGGGGDGGGGSGGGSDSSTPPAAPVGPPAAGTTTPSLTSVVPSAPVVPSPASVPGPVTGPTVPPVTSPTTGVPIPTVPTTTAPTTTVAPASLSVSIGTPGPAYAGLALAMPVTIGNAPAGAAAFGRSVGPALSRQAGPATQPTLTLALPTGVTFAGVDNPAWACTTTSAMLQCLLPALAAGESSSGLIQLGLADTVSSSITLQLTIADGSGAPVSGPAVVIAVQPRPPGLTDLVVDHADLALVGNATLTCNPAAVATCAVARDNPAGSSGQVDKSGQQMMWIDVDTDPVTFNSSSATLDLPPGAEVLTAQLVWGGTTQVGQGGRAPPDPTATGTVLLAAPAMAPVAVNASSVSLDPTNAARYFASADVTALVAAGGAGTYTAANLQIASGFNAFGGWALQVVFRDPAAPLRMVALADQIVTVNQGGRASIVLSGLAPATVPRTGSLSFAALEGDYGNRPESISANGVALSDSANAPNNPLNGSITTLGARAPAFVNNFGFDADRFDVTVAPGATEVAIDFASSLDRFRIAATGIVVPV